MENWTIWVTIISRRRSTASARSPPKRETLISGIAWATPMSPTCSAELVRRKSCQSSATVVKALPSAESTAPPQKRRKSRCWRAGGRFSIARSRDILRPAADVRTVGQAVVVRVRLVEAQQLLDVEVVGEQQAVVPGQRGHLRAVRQSLVRRDHQLHLAILVPGEGGVRIPQRAHNVRTAGRAVV